MWEAALSQVIREITVKQCKIHPTGINKAPMITNIGRILGNRNFYESSDVSLLVTVNSNILMGPVT